MSSVVPCTSSVYPCTFSLLCAGIVQPCWASVQLTVLIQLLMSSCGRGGAGNDWENESVKEMSDNSYVQWTLPAGRQSFLMQNSLWTIPRHCNLSPSSCCCADSISGQASCKENQPGSWAFQPFQAPHWLTSTSDWGNKSSLPHLPSQIAFSTTLCQNPLDHCLVNLALSRWHIFCQLDFFYCPYTPCSLIPASSNISQFLSSNDYNPGQWEGQCCYRDRTRLTLGKHQLLSDVALI